MTGEEIKELKGLAASMGLYDDKNPCKRAVILGKAIEALEQESCDDAISREEAIRVAEQGQIQGYEWQFKKLCNLPPVTPQTSEDCISRAELLENTYLITDDEGITHEVVHADDIRYAAPVTWSGWTPATQPPEPNTAVLLYVRYKSTGRWTYQLGMWNDKKGVWEDWRTSYNLEEEFDIIEWMETPDRYKEDKHE